jgi:hypothetical protein
MLARPSLWSASATPRPSERKPLASTCGVGWWRAVNFSRSTILSKSLPGSWWNSEMCAGTRFSAGG